MHKPNHKVYTPIATNSDDVDAEQYSAEEHRIPFILKPTEANQPPTHTSARQAHPPRSHHTLMTPASQQHPAVFTDPVGL